MNEPVPTTSAVGSSISKNDTPVRYKRNALFKLQKDEAKKLDDRATKLYNTVSVQAQVSYYTSLIAYVLFIFVGIGSIAYSLYIFFTPVNSNFQKFFYLMVFLSGIFLLIILFYNAPVKQIRRSLVDLMKINLIHTGFMRQIQQADASFQRLIESDGSLDIETVETTLHQVQEAVEWALEAFNGALNELDG